MSCFIIVFQAKLFNLIYFLKYNVLAVLSQLNYVNSLVEAHILFLFPFPTVFLSTLKKFSFFNLAETCENNQK